jgi:hypothetical protein
MQVKKILFTNETVMNCDVDYVNTPEKHKCLGNAIDGNIFNKHNDQEKKTLVKRIFFTSGLVWVARKHLLYSRQIEIHK